jgi:hypothetical protein
VQLHRGIPLGLVPRFQSRLAWIDRVQINGGVEVAGGHVYPRRDWRRLHDAELALLLADGEAALSSGAAPARSHEPKRWEAVLPCSHVGLLNLPSHLRQEWWALAERGEALAGDGRRYRAFVEGVIEFLRFKRLPLPPRCRVDVVVSRPGEPSTRWDATSGCAGGLGFSVEQATHARALERAVAIINLGDEPTHLALLNLAPSVMASMLGLPWPVDPALPFGPDLLGRFFTTMPTYPLIRMRLEAGDGLWLPARGVVYDLCTLDKREVDVALTIHGEAAGEA